MINVSVLCDLFVKADTDGDGRVSYQEFMAICNDYGVQLSETGKEELASIFGLHRKEEHKIKFQIFRNDFFALINKMDISKHFQCPDPINDIYWNNLAMTAFK